MKRQKEIDVKTLIMVLGSLLFFYTCIFLGISFARTKIISTDLEGRKIAVPYPIERIIVTDDTVADVVRLFGRQRCVVGIEESIPGRGYFPEMSRKVITGNQWRGLNWEKILQLKPDIILISDHPACTSKIINQAKRFNIPVLPLRWRFPEDQDKTVRMLGEIFGEEGKAEKFIQWKNNKLQIVKRRVENIKEEERLKAYLEVAFSGPVGKAAGRGKPASQVMEIAGLRNICEFRGQKEVSAEWIAEKNPDIIIMCDYAGGAGGITGYMATDTARITSYLEEIKTQPRFKKTNAVKKNRVYLMNTKLRGSMHFVGVFYLAKAAYPEKFEDVDPERIHKEFFEKWMGINYRGIWFYPEP
ncbi:ABC transporter substrate-binding protein [Candidatus Aerophobetes bacterium]|nr:ABC transporter substrate-binding protein [Candidatus Aerophobetes bacterium]